MGKRRRGSGERFIALHHWMLRCPAWKALTPNAKAVLLHIWQRHNGSNNGEIVYSVREAIEIGLARSTAGRALTELIELGFLRITRASAFTLKTKEARLWALTSEAVVGQSATKDFMRWEAGKFRTQSHQRDGQSHQRDCGDENGLKTGLTQSHQRDRQRQNRPPHSPTSGTLLIYHARVCLMVDAKEGDHLL